MRSGGGVRVGIDVGGTKCLGVVLADDPGHPKGGPVTGEPRVLAERQVPTPAGSGAILDVLEAVIGSLEAEVGAVAPAVGVGLPGLVGRDNVLHFAPNLRGAAGLAMASLAGRIGRPVRAENDATCAAWGERIHGAAQGADDVVLVTLGTGIGGGLVVGGRLVLGANGFAAEVGHTVVDPHGPPCPCGRRGCWERFGSGTGLGRLAMEAAQGGRGTRLVELAGGDPDNVRGEHVTAAAREGDAEAEAVLAEFAEWVALGLANLANVLDPEVIVVGGGMVQAGELLLEPVRRAFDERVIGSGSRRGPAVVGARLGSRAGAVGAACLGMLGAAG